MHLPASVESIGNDCFRDSTNLKEITVGASLASISEGMLRNTGIARIDVPATVASIGPNALRESKVEDVRFLGESGLTSISENAFASTPHLGRVVLPAGLERLGQRAFYDSEIRGVSFSAGCPLESLEFQAFGSCAGLTDVALPPNCVSIGERCFEKCASLAIISLRSTVRAIEYMAFGQCALLREFVIPESSQLSEIKGRAFFECSGLTDFTAVPGSGFCAEGGILYDSSKSSIFAYLSANRRKEITIEGKVRKINKFAFQLAANLERVVIPASVGEIGFQAFDGCSGIASLQILSTTLTVEKEAFRGCVALRCDSVEVGGGISRGELIAAGIPPGALEHCPTQLFTHGMGCGESGAVFASILADECAE